MDLGLTDKRVLVTGGTRGIGRATALAFAAEGARVALTYHSSAEEATALAKELGGHGRALAVPYDLVDLASVEAAVRTVEAEWGGVDVLVANAVRWGTRPLDQLPAFQDMPLEEWLPVLRGNLEGHIRTVQLVVGGMRERGWGRIALISSNLARDGMPGSEFYGAAKAGLLGFARGLAWDASPDGVLVNVVAPGLTLTEHVQTALPRAILDRETGFTPSRRLSTPDDLARAIVFLCSAANGNITGEYVSVAGGR